MEDEDLGVPDVQCALHHRHRHHHQTSPFESTHCRPLCALQIRNTHSSAASVHNERGVSVCVGGRGQTTSR